MGFDAFLKELLKAVSAELPAGRQAEYRTVKKPNNVSYTGMCLKNGESESASPIVYMEPIFEKAGPDADMERIAKDLARILLRPIPEPGAAALFDDPEFVLSHVVFRCYRIADNEALLETVPHRVFLDLAVTYGIFLAPDADNCGIAQITDSLMKQWNLTEEKLYELACRNSKTLLGERKTPLIELLPEEFRPGEEDPEPRKAAEGTYILTNRFGYLGSSLLFYSDLVEQTAKEQQSDLYLVMPVAHEILTVPVDSPRAGSLRSLAASFFFECCRPEESLSSGVYRYSLETKRYSVVSEEELPLR